MQSARSIVAIIRVEQGITTGWVKGYRIVSTPVLKE
jgi:hypothetical protein